MSLYVETSDGLRNLVAAVCTLIHRACTKVHQDVLLQLRSYTNDPGPTTIVQTRTDLSTGDYVFSPRYASLEVIRPATCVLQEASENLSVAMALYKKDYERHVRPASILRVGDYIFMDKPPFFPLAAKSSTSEGNGKFLSVNRGL